MKILLLQNWDMGLYLFRKELIEHLLKENEVFFSTPDGEYVELISSMGGVFVPCELLKMKGRNLVNGYRLFKFYQKIIGDIKPDVVFLFTLRPLIYGGIACSNTKVHYFPNITGYGTDNIFGKVTGLIVDLLMKRAFRDADCVFFQNSVAQSNMSSRRIVRGKCRLLPGSGVNLAKYRPIDYPSNDREMRFLFVGRIRKDKGIEEFLFAISALHKENYRIVADVVGDIEEKRYKKILEKTQAEGAILVHGLVDDVIPFYANAHCVVLPSYHEGLSNALLEAASIGRPIIASNVPGCVETFDEGLSGFACNARDRRDLYKVMKRFSELSLDDRKKMGLLARKKMEKEYDRKMVVDAYSEELSLLVQRSMA